jgi:hypothetical protein
MEWKLPKTKMFKSQTSACKVILRLFWDFNGSILEHYHEQGTTVTAALYTEILESKLKLALCNKHRGFLSRGVLLLHSNTLPHFMTATIEAIRQLKFELLPHSPFSPDLAPSDYHMSYYKSCVYEDLPVVMKLKMWCMHSFNYSQKLSLQMAL